MLLAASNPDGTL